MSQDKTELGLQLSAEALGSIPSAAKLNIKKQSGVGHVGREGGVGAGQMTHPTVPSDLPQGPRFRHRDAHGAVTTSTSTVDGMGEAAAAPTQPEVPRGLAPAHFPCRPLAEHGQYQA